MSETVFPPCPNWFLPSVLSCNLDGTIAYGSRGNIVICRHKPDLKLKDTVSVSVIGSAHKERVNTVHLSTAAAGVGNFPDAVASSGDDSIIKLWDVHTHALILEQNAHVGQSLVAVDWSRADPDLIVSIDKHGLIAFWNLYSNVVQRVTFHKLNATCLSCSPHQQDVVAVGAHNGLVSIISSKNRGQVIHRMRGHDEEVCALAWCPVDHNVLGQDELGPHKEFLLASGCKGRQVFVWRTHTDGRVQAKFSLQPHPFTSLGRFVGGGGTGTFYMCLLWPEPTTLVTNAMFGELLSWNLKNIEEKEKITTSSNMFARTKKGGWPTFVRMLHSFHSRAAYIIACPPYVEKFVEEESNENGGGDCQQTEGKKSKTDGPPRFVWTTSQDRYLVACNLHTGKLVAKIPTFSSSVYSITASPLDPARVGIGVGDAAIRVWNLNQTEEFDVSCFWQRIKSKVLSLAWHPLKENVLAFATGEGRIGLLNVSGAKPPVVFKMQHRSSVYSMCWGPYTYRRGELPDNIPEVALYTCGNGEVFQFDPSSPEECSLYPVQVLKQVSADKKAVQCSEMVWKLDNTIFAAGLSDGSVHVFSSPHLSLLHSVYSIKKYIQMLAWHPESTATDTGFSQYRNWLAVAANEKTIRVFNFTPVVDGPQDGGAGVSAAAVECCSVLNGHEDKVPRICWNPHMGGQLVSVSYDGTALVWDVPSQTPLVVFSGHDGAVFSCLWSPLDPDLILTGGGDATVRTWRVSRQTYQSVQELVAKRKRTMKLLKRSNEVVEKKVQQETEEVVAQSPDTSVQATETRKVKAKSLLSVKMVDDDKLESYLDACRTLLEHGGEENIPCAQHEDTFPLFSLYGDRESVCRLLDKEARSAKESVGIADSMQHFEVWKGNVTELLKSAAREKRLSTLLVSLAPLASPRLWLEMCKVYADQLAEAGQVQKAASYLVACHRLEEAIALLVSRDRFSDALVLAKCRRADPVLVATILRKWAAKFDAGGKLELAAERLLAVGDLDGACQLYARSNHVASHRFAALVARKAGQTEKAVSIAKDALAEHLVAEKWDVADGIIGEHPQLKPLAVLVATHRLVVTTVAEDSPRDALWGWITSTRPSPQASRLDEIDVHAAREDVSKEQLNVGLGGGHTPSSSRQVSSQMWLEVSRGLCLAWAADGEEHVLRHLLKVVDAVYQTQLHTNSHPHLLLLVCSWLAPRGPLAERSVFVASSQPPACGSLVQSLRAYLCAAVVFWLEGFLQNKDEESLRNARKAPDDVAADKPEGVSNGDVRNEPRAEDDGGDAKVKHCEEQLNGEVSTGTSDSKWVSVCRILMELVGDVVNADVVQYFKTELQIKQVATSLALAVAGGATSPRGSGDSKKGNKSTPDCVGSETKQEVLDAGNAHVTGDCADVSEEADVMERIPDEVDVNDACDDVGKPSAAVRADERVAQHETRAGFHELDELKRRKEIFETERVSVPNPYFLWFKLQNVCQTLLLEHEPQSAECLHSRLAQLRASYLE